MGLIADEQPAIYKVLDTAGMSHGKPMQSYPQSTEDMSVAVC